MAVLAKIVLMDISKKENLAVLAKIVFINNGFYCEILYLHKGVFV